MKRDSYLWHEKYSVHATKMLGFVAVHVTSKLCGIGPAERSWGAVKRIKDGKQSHLSGESTEKRSITFVSAKKSQIKCDRLEGLDASGNKEMFGNDNINLDLQLEKFGVDLVSFK